MEANINRDWWEKSKIISQIAATIAVPTIVAIFGYISTEAIKSREVAVKYTELAVSILSSPVQPGSESLRDWSTQVISKYSGIELSPPARKYLTTKDIGGIVAGEMWYPNLATNLAYSVVVRKDWANFLTSPGDGKAQAEKIEEILIEYLGVIARFKVDAIRRDHFE